MTDKAPPTSGSPIALVLSSAILLLVLGLSALGVASPDRLYPGRALHLAFVPVDGLNLTVVVPLLALALVGARRGSPVARAAWVGLLAVVLYTYIPYLVAIPFGPWFLGHLAVVVASAYTVVAVFSRLDGEAVARRLRGRVPPRVLGGLLMFLGGAFLLRNVAVILGTTGEPSRVDLGVWIADALLFPAFLASGLLLWRDRAAGHAAVTPVLLASSMLFIELVPVMAYPALYDGAPLPWFDIGFVLTFGLVCFVPLAACVRALRRPDPGDP